MPIFHSTKFLGDAEVTGQFKAAFGDGNVITNLNADLLDGQHGSYYAAASSLGNYLPLTGGILTGNLTLDHTTPVGGQANSRSIVFTYQDVSVDYTKALYVNPSGILVFDSTAISLAGHTHGSYNRATSVLSGANVFSDIVVSNGIVTGTSTRALTASDIGAAAASHAHGSIANDGTIAVAAVTPASTDYILISDTSDSSKISRGILIGSGTTTYLRNDGTWGTPAGTYSLPLAANGTRGGIQIGYTETGNNFAVQLSSEKAFVTVPLSSYLPLTGGTLTDDLTMQKDGSTEVGSHGIVFQHNSTLSGGDATKELNVDKDGVLKFNGNTVWHSGNLDPTDYLLLMGDQTIAGTKTFSSTIIGSVSGNAGTATTLQTSRTIAVGTAVSSTATSFNGSANITIPINSVSETYLSWGGKSLAGQVTPIGMSLSNEHSANRLAFINGNSLYFEYSSDAGSTWSDYGYSATTKSQFCTTAVAVPIGRINGAEEYTTLSRTRVTLTAQNGTNTYVYTNPRKMLLNITSSGGMQVLVEYRTGANYQVDGAWSTFGTYTLSGWSGWNDLPLVLGTLGGGTTQTGNNWQLRLTFIMTSKNTTYPTVAYVNNIRIYGENAWSTPSTMAATNHLYSFDMSQNVTFPGTVQGTQLKSTIATGTAPFTVVSTTVVTNLNADTLDGNHSTAFAAASHAHGNITSDGKIGGVSGLVVITTTNGVLTTLAAGSAGQYLSHNGTWGTPAGTYSLPLAANGTRGGIQIGYAQNAKNYPVQLSGEKAYVNVPWTDTVYTISKADVESVLTGNITTHTHSYLPLTGGTLTGNLTLDHDTPIGGDANSKSLVFTYQNASVDYNKSLYVNPSGILLFDGTGVILGSGTANQIAYFSAAGTIANLSTATYPSLTELSYVKGVTSAIQTQLGAKQATITGAATTIVSSNLTASRVLVSDGSGKVAASSITSTTLGYLDATSSIQTQLNGKQATITGAATTIVSSNLTASRLVVSDGSGKIAAASVTATEAGYLSGVTSAIQTQLNGKAPIATPTFTTADADLAIGSVSNKNRIQSYGTGTPIRFLNSANGYAVIAADDLKLGDSVSVKDNMAYRTVYGTALSANTSITTTYANRFVRCTNGAGVNITLTIGTGFTVGDEIHFSREGVGEVTIALSSGTLNSESSKRRINALYQVVTAKYVAANVWLLFGALKT